MGESQQLGSRMVNQTFRKVKFKTLWGERVDKSNLLEKGLIENICVPGSYLLLKERLMFGPLLLAEKVCKEGVSHTFGKGSIEKSFG